MNLTRRTFGLGVFFAPSALLAQPSTSVAEYIASRGAAAVFAELRQLARNHAGWLLITSEWVDASEILPWCQRMGLDTIGAVSRRANKLAEAWSYPDALAECPPVPSLGTLPTIAVADLHRLFASQAKFAANAQVQPSDAAKQLPTEAQLDALLMAFPGANREFRYGYRECEEFSAMFTGWLADQGMGNLAIGMVWLAMSNNTVKLPSGHVTIIAATQSRAVYWLEAKDRARHPISFTKFRGYRGTVEDRFLTADAATVLTLVI